MDKSEFMQLMSIPTEWEAFGMYPDELFAVQMKHFNPSHIEGSEHDRNGMFHWWLRRQPSKSDLIKLVTLSRLDPDQLMGEDVRSHIARAKNADGDVQAALLASEPGRVGKD